MRASRAAAPTRSSSTGTPRRASGTTTTSSTRAATTDHRLKPVMPQGTAGRSPPGTASDEAGEHRGGLLGVVAGDVEVGHEPHRGGPDGRDQDAGVTGG